MKPWFNPQHYQTNKQNYKYARVKKKKVKIRLEIKVFPELREKSNQEFKLC